MPCWVLDLYDDKSVIIDRVFETNHPSREVRRLVHFYCGLAQATIIDDDNTNDVKNEVNEVAI